MLGIVLCRKAVPRFCCYAPGGRSGEYRNLTFAKGRGTFLVMPMPESSMVKVELVLSGMISDAYSNKPQPLSEESRASILHTSPTRCMPSPTPRKRNGPRSFDEEVGLRLQLRSISMHRFSGQLRHFACRLSPVAARRDSFSIYYIQSMPTPRCSNSSPGCCYLYCSADLCDKPVSESPRVEGDWNPHSHSLPRSCPDQ